jgi:hypothetical protein
VRSIGEQLDLLDLIAGAARCHCGHRQELHYHPEFIREDRRACRAFCCHCHTWKEDP